MDFMNLEISILKRIWKNLSIRRRKQFLYLNVIILITGLSEIFSVTSLVPFLNIISNSNTSKSQSFMSFFYLQFNKISIIDPLLLSILIFLISISIASILRLITIYKVEYISAGIASDFSRTAYKLCLNQPYEKHLKKNSSNIISAIVTQTDRTVFTIRSILYFFSSLVISFVLIFSLFVINWRISLSISFIFISLYLLLGLFFRLRLNQISNFKAKLTILQTKILQEGLGSIRDIILDNNQNYFLNIFSSTDSKLRFMAAKSDFIAQSPKYIFEIFTLSTITIFAFILNRISGSGSNIIPILGSIIFGLQRLLPSFQLSYNSWVTITVNINSVNNFLDLLDQTLENKKYTNKIEFKQTINLKNINFSYFIKSKKVLQDFNFIINKGEKIGLIGPSGSGKSTIVNIIMGLLRPSSGNLLIDGIDIHNSKYFSKESWFKNISHVPQEIYLADSSIAENIAFGIPKKEIDDKRLIKVINEARISDLVKDIPSAYSIKVGERGVQLSGGQRQRIGIARALYKGGKILILDEATSALDTNTEDSIMEFIKQLNKEYTLIIVSHRKNALKFCDRIIKLNENN